jgi:energy-coupling factor transport system ATP-binding protein
VASGAVAVGGILMMRPKLYVVDEPLANLDPATASQLLAILRRMADGGQRRGHRRTSRGGSPRAAPRSRPVPGARRGRLPGPVDGFLEIADPALVKLPFGPSWRRFDGRPSQDPPCRARPSPAALTRA